MYPKADLSILAARKQALLQRIDARREESASQMREVIRPAEWAEDMYARWRAIPPLVKMAAVPVGVLLVRKLAPRFGRLRSWAPLALKIFQAMR